jgi:hydrogenase maturation protease
MKILVYGYGNPGREDDGLGIRFAEIIETWAEENSALAIDVDMNYQLNIEDALTISGYDVVFFVDASMEPIDEYIMTRVTPSDKVNFSMHSVSASYITYLSREIYDKQPITFLIHIKGYQWELKEGLTEKAIKNMQSALGYFKGLIENTEHLDEIIDEIRE